MIPLFNSTGVVVLKDIVHNFSLGQVKSLRNCFILGPKPRLLMVLPTRGPRVSNGHVDSD